MSKKVFSRPQEKLLHEFIEKEAVAPWVRALSDNQMILLSQLPAALRDDMEQGTCYRVRKILLNIGISPIMNTNLLRKMIEQSRGSDLAFLYFILEGFYKTDSNTDYSLNEKFIMTAISRLDLPFTMRALDSILPVQKKRSKDLQGGHKIKRGKSEIYAMDAHLMHPSNINQPGSNARQKPQKQPYFQKLRRPELIVTRYRCPKPHYRVKKSFFEGFSEFHTRKNDERWFANYELQPSLRVVKRTIDTAVNQLLDSIQLPKLEEKSLCVQHQFMADEAQVVKDALKVAARARCLSIIDTTAYKDRARLSRILKQLEDDIDWHTANYKRITQMQLTDTQMIYNNCGKNCEMCHALVSTLAERHNMRVMYWDKDVERHATVATNNIKTLSGPNAVLKNVLRDDADAETEQKPFQCPKRSRTICQSGKRRATKLVDGSRVNHNSLKVACNKAKQKQEKMLFEAPTVHKPYEFHHMHIFRTKEKKPSWIEIIRNACLDALHRKQAYNNELAEHESMCQIESRETCQTYRPGEKVRPEQNKYLMHSTPEWSISSSEGPGPGSVSGPAKDDMYSDKKAKVLNEVVECAKRIVQQKFEQRRNDDQQKETMARLLAEEHLKTNQLKVLKYENVEHFDPDDSELMDSMLQDAMNILKKDRRFVVASFPEAYKLRCLREWIKQRYGKTYSQKDVYKSFKKSLVIFRAVMRLQNKTPKVDTLDMETGTIDFSKYNEAKKKGKLVIERYHKLVNYDLMDQTAFCWFAMGGHLWAQGPPKKLFYSYLPATEGDIQRVRPWH